MTGITNMRRSGVVVITDGKVDIYNFDFDVEGEPTPEQVFDAVRDWVADQFAGAIGRPITVLPKRDGR